MPNNFRFSIKPRLYARWIGTQNAIFRIVMFLGLLMLLWAPLAFLIYTLGDLLGAPNTASTTALVILYVFFIGLLRWWGKRINRWRWPLKYCGLVWNQRFGYSVICSLLIGFGAVMGLFGLEVFLGWATPQSIGFHALSVLFEGLVVALAIGFAEELLFRGWLLAELEADFNPLPALLVNSVIFASVHFIKPVAEILRTAPQFLGLCILGVALVWARRAPQVRALGRPPNHSDTSLAQPLGLHAGLVWGYYWVNVGGLVQYSGLAPEWVTGIDANPLAGLLGVLMLMAIATFFAHRSRWA